MVTEVPKIDTRSPEIIAGQVQQLLRSYAPEWKEVDDAGQAIGVSGALIGIFARLAGIVLQRLNQAPEKNFLAFLDLLGASLLPPQPARVPLTFLLAAGSAVDGVVPSGTQVAAPPAEGEKDPVIYETERQLVVTAAQMDHVFVLDPERDMYADRSPIVSAPAAGGQPLFDGETPIKHILYLGDPEFFSLSNLTGVELTLTFEKEVFDDLDIRWQRWDGAGWPEIDVQETDISPSERTYTFRAVDAISPSAVGGVESRWVRGRLLTPITPSTEELENRIRAEQLPTIIGLQLSGQIGGNDLAAEFSFANQSPLDTTTDFFPFGEKPKRGDTWLIAHRDVFSQAGIQITLNITLAGEVRDEGDPNLAWEFWNGAAWRPLTKVENLPGDGEVQDKTANLTTSGTVILRLPAPSAPREINGVESSWLRVRLASGDYGQEAQYELRTFPGDIEGFVVVVPPNFAPPVINSLKISYEGIRSAENIVMRAYNNFVFDPPDRVAVPSSRLKPFRATMETRPTLYLGFRQPAGRGFQQKVMSIYFGLIEPLYGQASTLATGRPELEWEYWNGAQWSRLPVEDGSAALTRPGIIETLPPADFTASEEFGQLRHWLRVRWERGAYRFKPRVRLLLLNTTLALQASTLRDEILGSSDGSKSQTFRATHTPILLGQRLEVREPERPSVAELEVMVSEESGEAITTVLDDAGRPREIWVRWRETPDFYGSTPLFRGC